MNRLTRLTAAAATFVLGTSITFAQQTTPTNPSGAAPGQTTTPSTPPPTAPPTSGTPSDPTMPTTTTGAQSGMPDSTGQMNKKAGHSSRSKKNSGTKTPDNSTTPPNNPPSPDAGTASAPPQK